MAAYSCTNNVYYAVIMHHMTEDKKRVTVAIPLELHTKLLDEGYGVTEAIIEGLELLLNKSESNTPESSNSLSPELVISLKDRIESLEEQLKAKDSQLENKDVQMEDRVKSLEDQLKTKDSQIEKLTENMQAQSVHIQTLINQKAIEAPGAKKPWWRFW
jgi:CII-binding regulator of phage lambda lysogenization HflD